VSELSQIDADNWIKQLGLSVRNIKAKGHATLLQQFEGKPEDYELTVST
jgi:hypothetical protein